MIFNVRNTNITKRLKNINFLVLNSSITDFGQWSSHRGSVYSKFSLYRELRGYKENEFLPVT